MKIGEEITVGRMGQQPMHIADTNVDPQHALLRRTGDDTYQIEDKGSTRGIFVFGMRIKRKTVKAETPILLGTFKTTVRQLLQDASAVDLGAVWDAYDAEKRKWDRYSTMVNSIRMLSPVAIGFLTQLIGQNFMISGGVIVVVLLISMFAGEKVLARKNVRIAEMNLQMQTDYVCPRCHRPLPLTPYHILRQHKYCPNPACNYPLP